MFYYYLLSPFGKRRNRSVKFDLPTDAFCQGSVEIGLMVLENHFPYFALTSPHRKGKQTRIPANKDAICRVCVKLALFIHV